MMELELKKVPLDHYKQTWDTTTQTEETLEMIVPDACPDILQVVSTSGQVLLLQREEEGGSIKLSGLFRLSVLYLPDGESGVRQLPVDLPFTCRVERSGGEPAALIVPVAELSGADTRVLNPRKILVRAQASIRIKVFSIQRSSICTGLAGNGMESVQQRIETQRFYLIASASERQFTCGEEMDLPASRPAVEQILRSHFLLEKPETKIIGNKLIVKGVVLASLLCQSEERGVFPVSFELPYSQILEVSGVGENAQSDLYLTLAGCSCQVVANSGGSAVSLSVDILLQAVVWDTIDLPVLCDAYDLSGGLQVNRRDYPSAECGQRELKQQSMRERWETESGTTDVLECRLLAGPVEQRQVEGKVQLLIHYTAELLCKNEEEQLTCQLHPLSIACPLELAEGEPFRYDLLTLAPPAISQSGGSVELRFELAVRYRTLSLRQFPVVEELIPAQEDLLMEEYPSIVLRALERGEQLWDVAKAYRTTIADIMAANELEQEELSEGTLLLIPRKR